MFTFLTAILFGENTAMIAAQQTAVTRQIWEWGAWRKRLRTPFAESMQVNQKIEKEG